MRCTLAAQGGLEGMYMRGVQDSRGCDGDGKTVEKGNISKNAGPGSRQEVYLHGGGGLRCENLPEKAQKSQIEGAESDNVATINDMSAERRKSVRFGVHAFGQFPSLPNARPDERSGSANLLNFEPDHRFGSASVWSKLKFGTEL